MKPMLRNFLGVLAGLVTGSVVNMALIMIGGSVIPPPEGADVTSMEGLKASLHLFETRHFLFPFLAHAVGTLVGAYVAARISVDRKMMSALVVGAFFLMGGIMNVMSLPAPAWFNATDLVLAYVPMAWLGYLLARGA